MDELSAEVADGRFKVNDLAHRHHLQNERAVVAATEPVKAV